MHAFVVEELLPPGMADSVVGHEENDRVLEVALVFEPFDDVADEAVGEPNRVEVGRPVRQQDRIVRVVGRQLHVGGIGPAPQQLLDAIADPPERLERSAAVLSAGEVDLGEEGLAGSTVTPVGAVVHGLVPLEVVVRLPDGGSVRVGPAGDRGVVAGFLEQLGDRPDAGRQVDLQLPLAAVVVMSADGGLVHPGNERRAVGRADRRRDVRIREAHSAARQAIEMRRLDHRLSVGGEIGRHVVDDDPEDVRRFGRVQGKRCQRSQGEDEGGGAGSVRCHGLIVAYGVRFFHLR